MHNTKIYHIFTVLAVLLFGVTSCEEPIQPELTILKMSDVTCVDATVNSLTFEWEPVEHADYYEVTVNNKGLKIVMVCGYELTGLNENTSYTLAVRAITNEDGYLDSNEVTCTARTAKSPDQPDVDPDQPGTDPDKPGTDPDPDKPTTKTKYATWFEMPVINDEDGNGIDDNDSNLYYASHICAGGEKAAGGNKLRNYTVCFSGEHHCPMWIAAPRHSCFVGSSGRNDSYTRDPDIPADIQYSSKSVGGGCNKGHMLGSAERTSSVATNKQVFYYSNIAPQLSAGFNTGGGGWNLLEDYIDGLVVRDTLYETIGCYFKTYTDGYGKTVAPITITFCGRNDVHMPTMFYYALIRTKSGNSGKSLKNCTADELQCVAFVRSHTNSLLGQKPSSKELMSIADLEKLTGFTYFPNVPNAPKSTFKASDWGL